MKEHSRALSYAPIYVGANYCFHLGSLYRNGYFFGEFVILVVLKMHAVGREFVEVGYRLVKYKLRRVVWLALYQLFDYRDVLVVDMRVGYDMDELARLKPRPS